MATLDGRRYRQRYMNVFDIVADRARLRRRIVVLDENFRITHLQPGSLLDDRVFGFDSKSEHLPLHLEQMVKCVIAQWAKDDEAFAEIRVLASNGIAVRIFPLFERSAYKIGVALEQARRRLHDST